jgi:hypothetical protein
MLMVCSWSLSGYGIAFNILDETNRATEGVEAV